MFCFCALHHVFVASSHLYPSYLQWIYFVTNINTFIRVLQEIKRISTRLITVAFITLIVLFAVRDISSGTKQFRFSGIRLVIKHTMQHVRHVNCYSCAQHNTPNTKQFRFKCSNCSQWYATSSYIANQSYCLT